MPIGTALLQIIFLLEEQFSQDLFILTFQFLIQHNFPRLRVGRELSYINGINLSGPTILLHIGSCYKLVRIHKVRCHHECCKRKQRAKSEELFTFQPYEFNGQQDK